MGTTDVDGKVLIEVKVAAEILGKSVPTVYRMIKRGELESRKIPLRRKQLVTLESVDRMKAAAGMSLHEASVCILRLLERVDALERIVLQKKDEAEDKPKPPGELDPDAVRALVRKKHKSLR